MSRPTVAPTVEPVTLAEARMQCRLTADDTTAEDTRLSAYIVAARGMAEQETGARLITQTWVQLLDTFPAGGDITLVQTPAQSITSVIYTNTAGTPTTITAGNYRLDKTGPRGILRPAYGLQWPTDVRADDKGTIAITYKAGFGDAAADVPQPIREWILLHVAAMYENRGAVGAAMEPLPYLARLLDEWRVYG